MAARTKVLFIGADAMDKGLMLGWMADGTLPNLKAMRDRSLNGISTTPPRRYSGAAWPNFYTGVEPDRHGRYLHTDFDANSYMFCGVRPAKDAHPPFWADPGMAGTRWAIVNIPYAPIVQGLNGIQVKEWGVHDMHDHPTLSHPPELAAHINERYGEDRVGQSFINNRTPEEFRDFHVHLIERVDNKANMICDYLDEGGWDVFMAVFDESHSAGHQFWHFHDPEHPLHSSVANGIGDPIRDVYAAIDNAVGRILARVEDETTVIFLTSHGMGASFDGNLTLDDILRRLEDQGRSLGSGALDLLTGTWKLIPTRLKNLLRPFREKVAKQVYQSLTSGDRRNRKCFSLPTQDQCGGVRINLVGRESRGIVTPGTEYDGYTEALIEDLYRLTDGRTGKGVIREIMRSVDLDFGNHRGDHADLILQWRTRTISWIESPKVGRIDPVYGSRKGDHNPGGLFFCVGRGVSAGEIETPVPLIDFAPTIARLIGRDLVNVDGKAIERICPAIPA